MNEEVRKEIIHDLQGTADLLEKQIDTEALKDLSEHAIENIAIHKDLELVSVAVLIYSLYKIKVCLAIADQKRIISEMRLAVQSLKSKNFGRYNSSIRFLYELIRKCDSRIKEHLQDVMDAARIKKGTSLLQHGLSIGQAAGLMGLSNWDLQQYVGKTTFMDQHIEVRPALSRLKTAMKIFQVTEKVKAK